MGAMEGFKVDGQAAENATNSVTAQVRYINEEWRDRPDSPRIGSRETRRANTSFQEVAVHDVRSELAEGRIDLDGAGFTLAENETAVTNFRDEPQIMEIYRPEMIGLVRRLTGAGRAFVFNHLIRTEKPIDFNDGYSRFVHCDYNMARLDEMTRDLLEQHEVTPEANWTYAWYNTWQPFDHEVHKNPLAMIDWQSVPPGDVIDYYYTGRGRDSLVAAPVYNPAHRFCYFPVMSTSEVLVFKQLDSRPDRTYYCPHSSFDDQTSAEDAPPRRSIEMRLLAVFE